MSTHDDDEEFVTVRLPKRTADLMDVSLEIGTSPAALRGQLAVFGVFGSCLVFAAIAAFWCAFTNRTDDFAGAVETAMGLGCLALGGVFICVAGRYWKVFQANDLL